MVEIIAAFVLGLAIGHIRLTIERMRFAQAANKLLLIMKAQGLIKDKGAEK